MSTTIRRDGRRVVLSLEEKARLLQVRETKTPGLLAVQSGSQPESFYSVTCDERGRAISCACRSWREFAYRCSHMLAAEWFLEAQRRERYSVFFNIHDLSAIC